MNLKKEHRELFSPIWAKNQASVDGKPFIQAYLYQHPAEEDNRYKRRVEVSSYNNLPDSILQRWKQIFNKGKITIQNPSSLDVIEENIDGKKNDTKAYAGILFDDNSKFGVTWNLIDLPSWDSLDENGVKKSEQARIDAKVFPYVSSYTQPNVMKNYLTLYRKLKKH